MKNMMYTDCNNNASFLKRLFIKVQELSGIELSWSISNLDFIPVDKGDFIGGIPDSEMEELYNFQKRILDEHTVIVTHNVFMALLENIRTIYEGEFKVLIRGEQLKIKVFDGDIMEVEGEIENELKLEEFEKITKTEALSFLKAHQPMPSDEEVEEDEMMKYEEIRLFFLNNPDEQCIPLFLNSFGGKNGFGIYQMVDEVIRMYEKEWMDGKTPDYRKFRLIQQEFLGIIISRSYTFLGNGFYISRE